MPALYACRGWTIGFIGDNGAQNAVQFTDQAEFSSSLPGFLFMNNVCVWQIDLDTKKYSPACLSLPLPVILNQVQGINLGHGELTTFAFPNAWAAELRYAWTKDGEYPGDTKPPLCE